MGYADKIPDIGGSLGYSIINTSWQVKETLRKAFLSNGFDITSDQFAVMLRLWETEGISQHELCQRTCKNKSNLTRILDSMEKRNLVYRELSKLDRRSYNIFLTEEGKKIKENLLTISVRVHNTVFYGITEEEAKLVENIMQRINRNIDSL